MRRRIHPAAAAGGAVVVGVGALYLAGLLLTGEEIPEGTRVRGVDIGGMSQAQARETLDRELAAAAGSAPLAVRIGDRADTVDPRTAGLRVDTDETAAHAVRPGLGPVTVIGGLFARGGEVDPVVRQDEGQARTALAGLAKKHDRAVREGGIAFDKGTAKQVPPRAGQALNIDASIDVLRSAYLATKSEPADLPTRETAPRVDVAETERALREFARPAMSGPVTLTSGGERITITPTVLGEHLTMRAGAGDRLVPKLDGKALFDDPAVAGPVADATNEAVEAELRLNGARVEAVTDGKPGREFTAKAVSDAVLPLLTKSGAARTGEVVTKTTQPKVTKEKLAALGLTEKMSSFTVDFEPAEYRTKNIGRAVELINGSVVLPGETWSFNRTVGERTKENGFVDGTIILNDQYAKAAGGGVSAVATTMFNAMFFAGVKPVEYGAHSFYIERYPEGREATVAWGNLDLKFTNDSGNAIYILAESTDSSVTVTFLGTKKYAAVEASKGPRTNVQEPGTRPGAAKDCQPQTPLEGFDVTVERIFRGDDGQELKREPFRTRYTPRDKVTCD
ncbi:VanW family protein [Streptomyces sp. NPDC020965]|uniref:VanW family protein n=1 Tax=Streptomyces sp. NPDC020965 TaxID=3365105 RepID=UPI0037A8F326